MTTLGFMLQGIIAWGVVSYSIAETSAADEDLSSGITTSEFPRSAIMWTLTALVLSARTGRYTVVDIMGLMFVTVPFKAFVETLGFVLLVLMNAPDWPSVVFLPP
ncbi:hypothetical protein Esi_0033_0006 [Ectocarpus siliculosus]|uniref:Uncharacterized protein n=1 Tax=Ectocarpus siliculosus TaxID=2880 RepID=D7FXQ0_ECTSI|nr:hypothetical protein Esi_0033_0006 [Ectocarpus siliculosus]|eukprot:CBJ26417.1 hypothetical protein Esi_0033_0006 [Ectocarpus siliculosus]